MKITFERFDFVHGQVAKHEREIDSAKVLAGNAFFNHIIERLRPKSKTTEINQRNSNAPRG